MRNRIMIVVIWSLGLFGGGVPAASGGGASVGNMTMALDSQHENKITLKQTRELIRILKKTPANNSSELYKLVGYIAMINKLQGKAPNPHYMDTLEYTDEWSKISQILAKLKARDILSTQERLDENQSQISLLDDDIEKYRLKYGNKFDLDKDAASLQGITLSQLAKITVTDDQVKKVLEYKGITLPPVENMDSDDNDVRQGIIRLINRIFKYLQEDPSDEVSDLTPDTPLTYKSDEVSDLTPDTPLTYNSTAPIIFRGLSYSNFGKFISDGACQLIDPKTNANRFRCKVDGSSPDKYFLITWKIDNGWILPDEIETQDGSKGKITLTSYSTNQVTLLITSLPYLCGELNSGEKIIAVQSDKKENVVTRMMKIINDQSTKQYTLADQINDMIKFIKLIVNYVRRDDSDTHRGGEQDITSEVLRKYLLSVEPEKKSVDSEKESVDSEKESVDSEKESVEPEKQLTLTLEGVAEIQNELEEKLKQEMANEGVIQTELEQKLQQGMTRQRIIEGMIQKKLEEKLKQEMTLERIIQKFKKCTYYYYIKAKLNEQDVTIKRDLKLEDNQGWEIFIKQLTEDVCELPTDCIVKDEDEEQQHLTDLTPDRSGPIFKDEDLKKFLGSCATGTTFTGHEIAQIMKLIYLIAMDGYMRGAKVLPGYADYHFNMDAGNKGEGFCLDRLMNYGDLLTDTTKLQEIQQTLDFVDVLYEFVKTNFEGINAQIIPFLRDGFKTYHKTRDTAIKDAQEVQEGRGIG